jgi:hypothetical protein
MVEPQSQPAAPEVLVVTLPSKRVLAQRNLDFLVAPPSMNAAIAEA